MDDDIGDSSCLYKLNMYLYFPCQSDAVMNNAVYPCDYSGMAVKVYEDIGDSSCLYGLNLYLYFPCQSDAAFEQCYLSV